MAQNLKAGEKVTVTREIHTGKDTPAFKAGLKHIKRGQVGEVVGPAQQGRATYVKFNDIQVGLTNQSIERIKSSEETAQSAKKSETATKSSQQPKKPTAKKSSAPSVNTSKPSNQSVAKATTSTEAKQTSASESGLQMVTTVANNLLLKGKMKIDPDSVIELNLADLPEETRRQIQALIDAKLSLKP